MEAYMKGKLVLVDHQNPENSLESLCGVGKILGYEGRDPDDQRVVMVKIKVVNIYELTMVFNDPKLPGKGELQMSYKNLLLRHEIITLPATSLYIYVGFTLFDFWIKSVYKNMDVAIRKFKPEGKVARFKVFLCNWLHDHPWADDQYK